MEKQIGEMPSSADAENSVLGCILMDGEDCFDKALHWIRNDDAFYIDNNKKIWQAIKVLRQKKDPIDLITVSNELKENKETDIAYYLSGLPDSIVTSANIENHAKIVWEKYVQREVRKTSYKMNGVSFDKYKKTMPLINKQLKWLEELRDLQPDRLNNLDAMVDEAVDYIKSGENVTKSGFNSYSNFNFKAIEVESFPPDHGTTQS